MRFLYLYLLLSYVCCSYSDTPPIAQNGTESEHTSSISLSTDRIFYRFYLLQRLKPAIDLFLTVMNEKRLHDTGSLEAICTFQQAQIELFVHPLIQPKVIAMCAHHDSKVLIRLIETVSQYRYINDDEYVKEVIMLLLIVYENIIESLVVSPKEHETIDKNNVFKKADQNSVLNNFNTKFQTTDPAQTDMATSSLDMLLNTLDKVSEELEQLYHPQSPHTTAPWKPFATLITLMGATAWFWYAAP